MKKCKGCERVLPLALFSRHPTNKDRKQGYCKECDRKNKKEWYQKNLERERLKRKKWQEKHPDKHKKHVRDYYKRKRLKNSKNV